MISTGGISLKRSVCRVRSEYHFERLFMILISRVSLTRQFHKKIKSTTKLFKKYENKNRDIQNISVKYYEAPVTELYNKQEEAVMELCEVIRLERKR